ncbi:hypothetical protein AC249_AIPGENE16807, partial [Exaiptasia diaphana]
FNLCSWMTFKKTLESKRLWFLKPQTDTSYLLKNILPKERVEFTVTPVFNNTRFVAGTEAKAPVIRAP